MVQAAQIRNVRLPDSIFFRWCVLSLSLGCALLLALHEAVGAAVIAALPASLALIRIAPADITGIKMHHQGTCELISPDRHGLAKVESAFWGRGFVLLRIRQAAVGRHNLVLGNNSLSPAELSRLGRWLRSSPLR